MNTKFHPSFATLINKDGVQSTFAGHGDGIESAYRVLDNVNIGLVTRRKINEAVAQAACLDWEETLQVALKFIRADERCARILARSILAKRE